MHASVDTRVDILDGAAGRVLATGFAAHGGGGWTYHCDGIPASKGNGVYAQCNTNGAQVRVSASGYTGAL
jgi:hypothetical protein